MKTKLASAVALLALAGCATTPFSYIDGNRYFKTDMPQLLGDRARRRWSQRYA